MQMFYRVVVKPIADRAAAAVLLLVLSPIMLLTAALIWAKLGRPIAFKQARPGKDGRLFTICKFRTMSDQRDENGKLLSDEKRLGSFGRALRSLSLDELPQLWNILKGDMSFIGPRPLLAEYLPRYNAFQARRHEVLPGITGWAQVNGRNAQSWDDRFTFDIYYADHLSFALDCKIAILTIYKVFKREGISEAGAATRSEFLGNGDRVYIYGAGGHGRVAAECAARTRSGLKVEGFIDDSGDRGVAYERFLELAKKEKFAVVLGVGDNRARRKIAEKLRGDGIEIATVIDKSAIVSPTASIGAGAVVFAGAIVNSGAVVGAGAIVNSGAIVEHDCAIGDFAHISPNAALAGGAIVKESAHIGIGASLTQRAIVGAGAIIGAGAVVIGEIPADSVALGVPAEVVKEADE